MPQYDGTIQINTKIDSGDFLKGLKKMSSQSKKLNNSISETSSQIDRLKKEISELQNAPLESSSVSRISADIDTIENKLFSLYEKRGMFEDATAGMFGGVGSKMIPNQAVLESMMRNNSEWKKLTADIDKTELSLEKYENKLKQAQATEQKKTDNQITKKSIQLEKACNRLDVYKTKLSEINGSESGIAKKLSHISDVAKGGFTNITKHASKSNNMLNKLSGSVTRFSKRIWGLLSSALVFSVLTKAFTALREKMAAAIKQNAQFSASMSKISGNLNSVFNNLLSAAMPALNAIINAIAKATSYLSAFVALLTGKTVKSSNTAADAANNQAGAVGGVGEAAKKASEYLNGYDEMNVQASENSSGGGGSSGAGSDITFEDTDISGQVADFLDRIKKAWENADFTDLGRIVGDKINDSLENIDWTNIKNTSNKIGKSVATFLNGVFETPGLFKNIGSTVAEALNTAIALSLGFAENFHWDSFGQALADSINGFFETFGFDGAARSVNAWLKGILKAASELLKKTDFELIGNKIGEFLEDLDFSGCSEGIAKVIWEAIKGGFSLLVGIFEEAPLEASLIAAFAILKFSGLGGLIAGKISTSIGTYLSANGLSLALKGVGLFVALEGIKVALTGETNLKNTIEATALTGLGTLMVTKDLKLALAATVAVSSFKFGNYLYENVPAVEKWSDLIVNTVGDLITGKFDLDKEIELATDLAVEVGIPQMEAKLTNLHAQITAWFAKKGINIAVGISTTAADFAGKVSGLIKDVGVKAISIGMEVGTSLAEFKGKVQEKINGVGQKAVKIGAEISTKAADLWAKLKSAWGNNRTFSSKLEIGTKISSLWNTVKRGWNRIKTKLTFPIKMPHFTWGSKTAKILGASVKVPDLKISWYANGGFPDMGQLFIARERGAEMVGNIGGKTAVANNDQITSAIAEAVGPAVYDAVTAAMANSNSGMGDIAVYVGGQKITDFIIKDVRNRTIASGGTNPLLV